MEDFLNFFFLNPFPSHYMGEDGGPEINFWAAALRSRGSLCGGWLRIVSLPPLHSYHDIVFLTKFPFFLFSFQLFSKNFQGKKG